MPLPRIAIVGRPNVGKSSLLNMLAQEKVSIVDPTAGTTRDRVSVIVELTPPDEGHDSKGKIRVEVTDTGGFGVYVMEGKRYDETGADLSTLTGDIEHQISEAVRSADLVMLVIDCQKGVTPQDEQVARLLRERVLGDRGTGAAGGKGKKAKKQGSSGAGGRGSENGEGGEGAPKRTVKVMVVANKCDGPKWEAHAVEAANLGFGDAIPISAKSNYFRRDFLDALYVAARALPGGKPGKQDAPATAEMRLAIIGKRNAGKSSLVNALAGEERVIVSEIAGTTRDAVDVRFEMDGRSFIAIDTAGLRKKKSFQDQIEHFAYDRAQRAIERADVVMLLIDATEPISQVDQQLAMLAQKSYKPVVLLVNKWDLVRGAKATGGKHKGKIVETEMYEEYLRKEFKGLEFAPIAFSSAVTGLNLKGAVHTALDLHTQCSSRVSTGKLNRVLRKVLDTRGPSNKLGTFAKAYFISQVATNPPMIVLVVNKPQLFTPNYKRFLVNRIRENVPFAEVPIKLIVKERRRARPEDLVAGERERLAAEGLTVVNAAEKLGDNAEDYFDDDGGEKQGMAGAAAKRGKALEPMGEEFSADEDILLGAEETDEE
ncbi:MAG TPA: ribosome biogenesis GTPase Der [Phycisphaerales bacterium]|nr:ribosome biogenesis GTPase Der [Phycisphaerales bacterium]